MCLTQIDPNWMKLKGIVLNKMPIHSLYTATSAFHFRKLHFWIYGISDCNFVSMCEHGVYGDKVARSKTPYFQKEMFFQSVCNHLIFIPLSRDILSKREISQKLERPLWDVCIWMQITQILYHGRAGGRGETFQLLEYQWGGGRI